MVASYPGRFISLEKTLGGRDIIPYGDCDWIYAPELVPLVPSWGKRDFMAEEGLIAIPYAIQLSEEIAIDLAASRLAGVISIRANEPGKVFGLDRFPA